MVLKKRLVDMKFETVADIIKKYFSCKFWQRSSFWLLYESTLMCFCSELFSFSVLDYFVSNPKLRRVLLGSSCLYLHFELHLNSTTLLNVWFISNDLIVVSVTLFQYILSLETFKSSSFNFFHFPKSFLWSQIKVYETGWTTNTLASRTEHTLFEWKHSFWL